MELEKIVENELGSLRAELRNHKLYQALESIDDVKLFMQNQPIKWLLFIKMTLPHLIILKKVP